MARKSNKSAAERLAEINAQRAKLELEMAREEHSECPAIQALLSAQDEVINDSKRAALAFASTTNNILFKLEHLEFRKAEYEAARAYFECLRDEGAEYKEALANKVSELIESRMDGTSDDDLMIQAQSYLHDLAADSEAAMLQEAYNDAKAARQSFREKYARDGREALKLANVSEG